MFTTIKGLASLANLVGNGLFGGRSGGSGEKDPIKAQEELSKKLAWNGFLANKVKLESDSRSAISAGKMDSYNKQTNSMITLAKGINF